MCDIFIPEWKNMKNIIVEVHGFQHFARNVKKINGGNELKKKIL
jgi:hypothetical protein